MLNRNTKIRLSMIQDFFTWRYTTDGVDANGRKHNGKGPGGGQFTREYSANRKVNRNFLKKNFDDRNIDEPHKEALRDYTTEIHKEINGALRENAKSGKPISPELQKEIKLIDEALSSDSIGINVKTYRTEYASPEELDEVLSFPFKLTDIPEDEWNDMLHNSENNDLTRNNAGFLSTSINKHFKMGHREKGQYKIRSTILVPKEAKGLYLEKITANKGQDELLLLRNNNQKISKINFIKQTKTFIIESEYEE